MIVFIHYELQSSFENKKAVRCELVKDINDTAEYAEYGMVSSKRMIKSILVNAANRKEALLLGTKLIKLLRAAYLNNVRVVTF